MTEGLNLQHKIGKGMSPRAFMESMTVRSMELSGIPNTKEQFRLGYEQFEWPSAEDAAFFGSINERGDLHCLILCTDWCPDVIWNVPVIFRAMEQARIPTEVLLMEEHLDTMDRFLTNGGRAQPIAVMMKTGGEVLGSWGPRPAYIQALMDRFKAGYPDKTASDYRDKLDQTYQEIGRLYRNGDEYRRVLLQELRERYAVWL